jgi:hypothetical protein
MLEGSPEFRLPSRPDGAHEAMFELLRGATFREANKSPP